MYILNVKTDRTDSTTGVFAETDATFVRSSRNREYYKIEVESDAELNRIEEKLQADDCVLTWSTREVKATKTWHVINDWNVYEEGETIYPVREEFGDGTSRLYVATKPSRTNMSGEELEEGWLGCTNGVHRYALGTWKVVKVTSRLLKDGRRKTSLKCVEA